MERLAPHPVSLDPAWGRNLGTNTCPGAWASSPSLPPAPGEGTRIPHHTTSSAGSWPCQPLSFISPPTTSSGITCALGRGAGGTTSPCWPEPSPGVSTPPLRGPPTPTPCPHSVLGLFAVSARVLHLAFLAQCAGSRTAAGVHGAEVQCPLGCSGCCDGHQPFGAHPHQDAVPTAQLPGAGRLHPAGSGAGRLALPLERLGTHCAARCPLLGYGWGVRVSGGTVTCWGRAWGKTAPRVGNLVCPGCLAVALVFLTSSQLSTGLTMSW